MLNNNSSEEGKAVKLCGIFRLRGWWDIGVCLVKGIKTVKIAAVWTGMEYL
jgi:hypothetical protein